MTTFNVMSSGRSQVLVDEQQLQQLQAEVARRGGELERLKAAMETLSAVNAPAHFMAAAMALCNELASRWHAERVGIGFLRGRYVRLRALSHTEKITRQMQLVQDIESAMEECLDQDVEVLVPPPKESSFVYRATDTLAKRHGPSAVISLPLRRANPRSERMDERFGNVVAVLTVERQADKPLTLAEIETLRLTCDLFTARLVDLYENDRWIGAKALRGVRRGFAWAVGAKHTWAKVAAIAVAGFLAFALLVDGTFRVEAPFVMEATGKQVISAPFDGFLKAVRANVGDMVFTEESAAPFDELNVGASWIPVLRIAHPPTVMANLEISQLVGQRDIALKQKEEKVQAARISRADPQARERQTAEAEALMSEEEAAIAQLQADLYQWEIDRATIKPPMDGIIFSGDLHDKVGAPVKTGDELYQVGQREKLRAELSVPEDQVSELKVGQRGQLKATSYPDRPVAFTVERINPVATVKGTKNIFLVRVALDAPEAKPWMRPGMEGLAKVDITHARYAWIWTHRMINWVRMKLWM